MRLFNGFDENRLKLIAKSTGNRQLVKDVSYGRFCYYRKPSSIYCEFIDEIGFVLCYINKSTIRIIGIGVAQDHQGRGYGRFLLNRAVLYGKEKGFQKIYTITISGVRFYLRNGFDFAGMRHGDYLLEKIL